jgi:serine/threonine-protein kinase
MTEPLDPLIGTILGGTFRVLERLGAGGMGAVFRAEHLRLPRSFVIKVLHQVVSTDSEAYHRFRREAEVCSRLRHQHIVEVVDFNVTPDGRPYIAMEHLEGEDLSARLQRVGPAPLPWAVYVLDQVAAALAEAHQKGVVHRDLKPQNIFLCDREGRDDYVKLLDFGISKLQGAQSMLTGSHAIMGTPFYMSPEQSGAIEQPVDLRTDVFALGVITFEMLSGQLPFTGENLAQIILKIAMKDPPDLGRLVPGVPAEVVAAVNRALAKEPGERFSSAREFVAALQVGAARPAPALFQPAAAVAATLPYGSGSGPVARQPLSGLEATVATDPGLRRQPAVPAMAPQTTLSSAASEELGRAASDPEPERATPHPGARWPTRLIVGSGAAGLALLLIVGLYFGLREKPTPPTKPAPAVAAKPDASEPVPVAAPSTNPWVRVARPEPAVTLGLQAGSEDGLHFRPAAQVTCCGEPFEIQQHEVTWAELEAWAGTDPLRQVPRPAHVPADAAARARLPVTGIPWQHASSYCQAQGGDLPTEAQWEYAARGPKLLPNPWGEGPAKPGQVALLVGAQAQPAAVCQSAQDKIVHGGAEVCDLAGNAPEWTRSFFLHPSRPESPPAEYPYGAKAEAWRAVRGLAPRESDKDELPAAAGADRQPGCIEEARCKEPEQKQLFQYTGFRCARAVQGGPRSATPTVGSAKGKSRHPVVVPTTKATVQGGLDGNIIRRVIRRNLGEIQKCYVSIGLPSNPKLEGMVKVSFTITPTGQVGSASVAQSTLNHSGTEACILSAVRRWTFPKPEGEIPHVTYPFHFKLKG